MKPPNAQVLPQGEACGVLVGQLPVLVGGVNARSWCLLGINPIPMGVLDRIYKIDRISRCADGGKSDWVGRSSLFLSLRLCVRKIHGLVSGYRVIGISPSMKKAPVTACGSSSF